MDIITGDAYVNQEQDVMNAVQVMRQRAEKAGNLASNSQQKVSAEGKTIVIEPSDPQVVYVPQYNPWIVYGAPLVAWPGWYAYPGLFWNGPGISFGLGFGLGFFGGFGWGWHHWGADWHHAAIIHNHKASPLAADPASVASTVDGPAVSMAGAATVAEVTGK